jgi:hypothetical protein
VKTSFEGRIVEWRGPAPYYYVPVPEPEAGDIHEVAAFATYGWGVIPVEARIDDVRFTTSLFPKDGGYLVPLKDRVRKGAGIVAGDVVRLRLLLDIGG